MSMNIKFWKSFMYNTNIIFPRQEKHLVIKLHFIEFCVTLEIGVILPMAEKSCYSMKMCLFSGIQKWKTWQCFWKPCIWWFMKLCRKVILRPKYEIWVHYKLKYYTLWNKYIVVLNQPDPKTFLGSTPCRSLHLSHAMLKQICFIVIRK